MNNIIKRVWNQNRMVNIEGLSGAAFQAEDGGHTFQISGIDDTGAAVALTGTVAGVFRRPDNADIALTGSASGGVASVTLTNDCYAVPGRFGLTIFVTSGGQKTAVYACIGTVAGTSGGAVAGETPQDVVDLINAIAAAVATIPADYTDLMTAIAPIYSTTALYPVGSYVWYEGILYRCTTPITTAETWTAAHWTAAVLGDDVGALDDDVGELKSVSDEVLEILEHPISYSKFDVPMSAYFTTIIDGVQLIAGTTYDISATLASSATQAYYLLLYKGETSVKSITIPSGSTTGTFYYDVTETGNDYSVKAASGAYAAHVGVSATVTPRTNGSILDDIEAKISLVADTVKPDNIISGVLHANFASDGTTLGENNDYLICYFPVVNGSVYTIDRGEPFRNSRIGYCTSIPYIGCTITGYAGLYGESVKTIQATADGYCCVLMRWSGDTVTVQQVLDMAYIYSGAYDPNVRKTTKHLDDISYMDKHDDSFIVSSNLFDGFYVAEKYLTNAGVEGSSASYGYTKNMIPVYPGYRLTVNSGNGSRMIRYVTAYDKNGNVLADKGYDGELYTGYIVPDGVYYVRISMVMTALTAADFRINNSGTPVDYDAYSVKPNNIGDMTRLNREPLTVLPDYFVNTMSYRPVGGLSKGYICMVTDDGTSGLATYTIPLAIAENVPFTFGVMHDSEVFADETMTATVVDAVNNHGCSVAQHGSVLWDVMSEKDLVNFFNNEKTFLAGKGLVAEGAIIPQHRTNNLVKAVAGGLYGVVRSGYDGKGEGQGGDVDNYSITNYYDYYTSGERSNIYGLSSYNCAFATKAYNHSAIDYAYANNKILIVYYHEFDIGDEQKEVIEDMIDYAKGKGITFTTLGNIRYIR